MRSMDEILRIVCSFLNKEKIDYVIVGGLAVIFYGIPRTTMDVDIMLQIKEAKIPRFIEFLKKNDFFASAEDMKTALKEKTHCTTEDKKSMIRLDVKGLYNETDKRTFFRRIDFIHRGTRVYLASPEDTLANKLVFEGQQDLKDALGIYVRQVEKLDMNYLDEISSKMGVSRKLEKLKKRVRKVLREK